LESILDKRANEEEQAYGSIVIEITKKNPRPTSDADKMFYLKRLQYRYREKTASEGSVACKNTDLNAVKLPSGINTTINLNVLCDSGMVESNQAYLNQDMFAYGNNFDRHPMGISMISEFEEYWCFTTYN
jgi:hypothetical protein